MTVRKVTRRDMLEALQEGLEDLYDKGWFCSEGLDLQSQFVGDNKLVIEVRELVRHPAVGELVNKFEIEIRKLT